MQNPPILHFNTMTSFSEAIIQSPIDVIWSHDSKSSAPSVDPQVLTNSSRSREQNTTATAPSPKQDSPWQTKTDPNPLQQGNYVRSMLRPDGLSDSSQDGTLNKPTLTPTSQTKSKTTQSVATSPVKYLPKVTYSAKKDSQPVKQAVTGDSLTNGPHCYECCPKKSVGQTPSLQGKATSLSTAEQSVLFSLNSEKPPFVVRHVDGDLISRRDFPKLSSTFRSATQVSSGAHRTVSAANRRSHSQPLSSVNAAHKQYYSGPTLSEQYKQYVAGRSEVHEDPKLFYSSKSLPASPKKTASYSKPVFTPQTKSSLKRFSNPSRPIHIYFESEDSDQCQEDDEDLDDVARLQVEPGNMRTRSQSPSQVLRERIGRLMDRCCDHRVRICVDCTYVQLLCVVKSLCIGLYVHTYVCSRYVCTFIHVYVVLRTHVHTVFMYIRTYDVTYMCKYVDYCSSYTDCMHPLSLTSTMLTALEKTTPVERSNISGKVLHALKYCRLSSTVVCSMGTILSHGPSSLFSMYVRTYVCIYITMYILIYTQYVFDIHICVYVHTYVLSWIQVSH